MPPRTNQNSQKKTRNEIGSSTGCVDRISDLPKNVIDYILEKLEIDDVVRTSVLSKKWRNNWTSLPQLTFSEEFTTHEYKGYCFESVISSILLQHIGPISKFSLSLKTDMRHSLDMINPWICFLSKNGVRDLTLNNYGDNELLILPSYFFSCSQLRVLTLCCCLFKTPFSFNGFRSLTSFTCQFVTFEGLSFESLLHCCPLIQELSISSCIGLGPVLSIFAPNLRIFNNFDCPNIEYISFKNTRNLSAMSIHLQGPHELPANEKKRSYISEFFSCLCNLENLSLVGEDTVQLLVRGDVPKRLPNLLYLLKDLQLGEFDFCNLNAISCLLCIIRSSPNLQLLHISDPSINKYLSSSKDDKDHILGYLEQQLDSLDCSLDHLHTIYVGEIYGAPPEMLMIKFLLASSPSLKDMVMHIHFSVAEKALWISKELLRFRRASSSAEVTLT